MPELSSFHAGFVMGGMTGVMAGFMLALTFVHVRNWWRYHPRRREDDQTIEHLRRLQ